MTEPYLVAGVATAGTHIQPRLEIRDLQRKPVQFSLFIQALIRLQNMNSSDPQSPLWHNKPNSWWQIGTIHGLPYQPWSGDPDGLLQDISAGWKGYCYHAAAHFPTWHRVQMLLVEQAVVNEAITIAAGLNNAEWLQAAKELRFPFWDWTRRETGVEGVPEICKQATLSIAQVRGPAITVNNPLSRYLFVRSPGTVEKVDMRYMGRWTWTYRWAEPDSSENPTRERDDLQTEAFSRGIRVSIGGEQRELKPLHWLREKVSALFSYDLNVHDRYGGNKWGYFSSANAKGQGIEPVYPGIPMPPSIEEPHNMVHLSVGGNGSMSMGEYAGFDPIFYLHHSNVDRLYAFWEYVYPEYWMGNGWWSSRERKIKPFLNYDGTFRQAPLTEINQASPLAPFRKTRPGYWTSNEVRSLLNTNPVNKYYTYPPIIGRRGTQIKVDVPYDRNNMRLRRRYLWILRREFSPQRDWEGIIEGYTTVATSDFPLPDELVRLLMARERGVVKLRHFYIIGELPEFAFNGSYRLELYLLNDPEKNAVNSISVFGRADPERCAACMARQEEGSRIRGYMPLHPDLILHMLRELDYAQLSQITNMNSLVILIRESLGMRLVSPYSEEPLAVAEGSSLASGKELEPDKRPTLTIYSHIMQFQSADDDMMFLSGDIRTEGDGEDEDGDEDEDEDEDHGAFGADVQWGMLDA